MRSKREFVQPLLIIPGPREPKNIDPYLELLLEELRELGPSGAGLRQAGAGQ